MLRVHKGYLLAASGLLLLELLIAAFVHDRFIRPYAGDFLATILLYCLLRSFLHAPAWKVAGAALAISYLIEGLQYVELLDRLGWHSRVARIVLGSHFEWGDVLAYTLGGGLALAASLRIEAK
ncbi:ribosomal maturation YjgA family protein [Hymenobacter daeguensis]